MSSRRATPRAILHTTIGALFACAIAANGGCGPRAKTPLAPPAGADQSETTAPTITKGSAGSAGKDGNTDPAFPSKEKGWKAVGAEQLAEIDRHAEAYRAFLSRAKTPRATIAALRDQAGDQVHWLSDSKAKTPAEPGTRFGWTSRGGDAMALVAIGTRPLEEGLRIVIVPIDGPRLDLEHKPVYEASELVMLDTVPYGTLDLTAWLSQPLALYVHAETNRGQQTLQIGEAEDDPLFVIPDLLPHLSRKARKNDTIDGAERLDAVAATKRAALVKFLSNRGLSEADFMAAEAALVPAGPASFVGVDRAMLGGYVPGHRAFAFAAVRAMASATTPQHTAIFVGVSKAEIGGTGATGDAFIRQSISRVVSELGARKSASDVLDLRRVISQSAALHAQRLDGRINQGIILDPLGDDALPTATRRVLDALVAAKVPHQFVAKPSWSNARDVATLDLDVVDVGIAAGDSGVPLEVVSILDVFHAAQLVNTWLMVQ